MDPKNKTSKLEQLDTSELGPMYLIFDQILVTQSSGSVFFFKIDPETKQWTQYYKIPKVRGQIYYIKGNFRIQITTDEKIYFILIDKETFMPKLENVMGNFMECSQMMFGSKVRFAVSFKQNERDFNVWCRK